MRKRERGIGNLPFIAVLVLFIIALALFFMKQDEVDTYRAQAASAKKTADDYRKRVTKAQDAYNALEGLFGIEGTDLKLQGDAFPAPQTIGEKGRAYLNGVVAKVSKAGEMTLKNKHYQVPQGTGVVQETDGEDTSIKLFGVAIAPTTIRVKDILDVLADQFAFAAKVATENNAKLHTEVETYRVTVAGKEKAISDAGARFAQDAAGKQSQLDQLQGDLSKARDGAQEQTAKLDAALGEAAQAKTDAAKQVRGITRDRNAWKNRAITEKTRKELALAEDPKDGSVLHASRTMGTVWINLGRRDRVSRGTTFKVWRPGKGNVRQDVAVIRVIGVDRTRSEARILKLYSSLVPVTAGMNISNPFFDPSKPIRVYIYGELKHYTTDLAKKRLAASGVTIVPRLDDTVNVIVLGQPSVQVEEVEEEEEAAAAAARAEMERGKRLNEVIVKATAISAIVVTEDTLATFIDY